MYCKHCDESFYDTVKICPTCGAPLENIDLNNQSNASQAVIQTINTCSRCGHINREGARFCEMCAHPFTINQPVPQPQSYQPGPVVSQLSRLPSPKKRGGGITLIILSVLFGFFILFSYSTNFGQMRDTIDSFLGRPLVPRSPTPASTPSKPVTVGSSSTMTDSETEQDRLIYDRIKERARKDHPDDYTTQKYVYERQVEAYKYMKTVPPSKLKAKIEKDHPYDFMTQKYVYERQVEAKEYIDSLQPSKLKDKVQRDHPNDYTTQKYVYDRQMEAKESMKK